jgi:hypothetical protein
MSRCRTSLIAALAALVPLVPLVAAANAHAATPAPFTITEHIDLSTDPSTLSFTATGPLCPSGSFTDDQVVNAGHPNPPGVFNTVNRDVYTCADGSGTFGATKLNHITVGDTALTNAGEIQLRGGTGDYTSLVGHGVDDGAFDYQTLTGVGNISGLITHP